MSSTHQTRSKAANAGRPKTTKKPPSKEDDDVLTLSSAEKKQLEKLTSKKQRIEKQQAAALKSGTYSMQYIPGTSSRFTFHCVNYRHT